MRSTCPNCLSQIEHAHSENQLVCSSCNETFSPFLNNASTEASSPDSLIPVDMGLGDFSESSMAFKDIIQFGEQMDPVPASSQTVSGSPKTLSKTTPVTPSAPPKITKVDSQEFVMTTGDLSAHWMITQWFLPLSHMAPLASDDSPLELAFHSMKEAAIALGANAVIGIRCSLAPDNKRALVLGTPVRCEKRP